MVRVTWPSAIRVASAASVIFGHRSLPHGLNHGLFLYSATPPPHQNEDNNNNRPHASWQCGAQYEPIRLLCKSPWGRACAFRPVDREVVRSDEWV